MVIKDCFMQKLQTPAQIYIIKADMRDFIVKKYALTEALLLAIFAAGLIVSELIVVSRSHIKLSPPSEAPASGFFVSMPQGRGWQTSPTWKFAQNSYYRTSFQKTSRGRSTTIITAAYLIAAGRLEPMDYFKNRAAQMDGHFSTPRIIKGHDVVTQAAMITSNQDGANIFCGIAALAGGRNVMLEVVDTTGDAEYGWNIVNSIAGSFTFKGNELLQNGQKLIASMRSKGLNRLLGQPLQENYFLISFDGRTDGFKADIYTHTQTGTDANVLMISSYYLNRRGGEESILQTNERFDRFVLSSSMLYADGSRKNMLELQLAEDGTMSIKRQGRSYSEAYTPGPAAISELLFEAVFREMLADGIKQAMLDFIGSEGKIVPSGVEIKSQSADPNSASAYIVEIRYFDNTNTLEKIYFNTDRQVEKSMISDDTSYTLNSCGKKEVLNEFPQWSDYIINLERMLKEDTIDGDKKPRRIVSNVRTSI
jgi:hypothetical protein